jgi:N-acylneuraminate cytidylyltransferase/CMP-N,N'-diacetyllegionaminic acid synthase
MGLEILALIPARGGSKGVTRKNLVPLHGKPLIAWTIDAALRSRFISRVVVTTDDREIGETAMAQGAEVPFYRPRDLSRDMTLTMPVVLHAIQWVEQKEMYQPDFVMLLQPTSPLRTYEDIDASIELLWEKKAESIVSVGPAPHPPCLLRRIDASGRLREAVPAFGSLERRQDTEPYYMLNGAIYLARRDQLIHDQSWYGENTIAYVMPESRSLDIDTDDDFHIATHLMEVNAREDSTDSRPEHRPMQSLPGNR